ncbi:hypothetical protein P167DRAFT_564357 [Morchella conica CCBAS932]|uniref:Uncharacterized protein n=1 Tax=Morchella conica CCBAS932 TaxID=1392247 RepID=A0A3N4KVG9_9PEZI|nr:hypothetical protein P167DRAFT_564357 [Morchella conica CCBAS932]
MATEYQQYSNFPGDFQNDLDALSASIYDDDLIPILDREDNSDLSHYESSRCSSFSGPSPEWICPLRDNVPSCNQLFGNVAYQIPRAPPPTPLVASPSVLPMLYNEENEEIPAFELSTSLKELGVCAAMGNAQTWWSMANAEDTKFSNLEDTPKRIPEPWPPACSFFEAPSYPHQAFCNNQAPCSPRDMTVETQLYQFPPLNSYGHSHCSPPTPPPSACSNRTSLDNDQEEIDLYSFLRQPYSMVEIDYQLQLLSIKQQAEHIKQEPSDLIPSSVKRGSRLRKASLSSIEKAGTLKRKISDVFKRSTSR